MSFASPVALWSLILVPLAVVGYVWLQRRRVRQAASFVTPAMLPNVVERIPGWRRHLPIVLLLLAVTSFLFGFARPHAMLTVPSHDATVVLAIDPSRSWGATDAAPTRLAAAQASARRFVARLPARYRVAVVSFSSRAQVVSAPTTDRPFVETAISDLRLGQGTALGDGLANAIHVATAGSPQGTSPKAAAKRPPAAILIFSDGAQDGGRVTIVQAVARARAARIPVFAGLVGTPDGVVQVPLVGGFIQRIRVPPDAAALQRVAGQTGGRFYVAPTAKQLDAVYADLQSRLGHTRKDEEITVGFAALGIVLLLGGSTLSALWFRRIP